MGRFGVVTRLYTVVVFALKGCGGKRWASSERGGCNPEKFFFANFDLTFLYKTL